MTTESAIDSEEPPPKRSITDLLAALQPIAEIVIVPTIEVRVLSLEIVDDRPLPSGDIVPSIVLKFRATFADIDWDTYDEEEKPPHLLGEFFLHTDIFEDVETAEIPKTMAMIISERAGDDIMELAAELHR